MKYCATEDSQWAREKLNALIDFAMHSGDEDFRAHLGEYLDVDGAIDYLIYIYVLGLPDSAAKDLVLLTYDDGPWIPTVYDMEHAFGLAEDGTDALPPEGFLPQKRDGLWDSGTDSLLWDRLLTCFEPEIQARYSELRRTALTEEGLTARVTEAVNAIPTEYMDMDLTLYPRETAVTDPLGQMTDYIAGRLPALDAALLGQCKEKDDEEGGLFLLGAGRDMATAVHLRQ